MVMPTLNNPTRKVLTFIVRFCVTLTFVNSSHSSAKSASTRKDGNIRRGDLAISPLENESSNITAYEKSLTNENFSTMESHRSMEEFPQITIINPLGGMRETLFCMTPETWDRRTEVAWIKAKNNWLLKYYVDEINKLIKRNGGYIEDMVVSLEIEEGGVTKTQYEFETLIKYSMEILYVTRLPNGYDEVARRFFPFEGRDWRDTMHFKPWSTPDLRKEYIDFLQCQPYRNETCRGEADRITSFDRLCSMSVNFCVEGGICEDDTYAKMSPTLRPTRLLTPEMMISKKGKSSNKLDDLSEVIITFTIYGISTEVYPENTTLPMWNKAGTWQKETSEFISKWYQYNTTVSNVKCTTLLLGIADESTIVSLNKVRSLSSADPPLVQNNYDRATQQTASLFVVYTQKFEFDYVNSRYPITLQGLSTDPLVDVNGTEEYLLRLQEHVSSNIIGISSINAHVPTPHYAYYVDKLVIAIMPLRGLDNVNREDFESALGMHISNYWTVDRKWAAIYDLDVSITTIVSRHEFSENRLSVQYQVHFRYRSVYKKTFLSPRRIVTEPFQVAAGKQNFLKLLGERNNNLNDRLYEVKFAGNLNDWNRIAYLKSPKQNRTLLIIFLCVFFLAAFFLMMVLLQTEKVVSSRALVEYKADETTEVSPTIDEDSLGEICNVSITSGESLSKLTSRTGISGSEQNRNEVVHNRSLLEDSTSRKSHEDDNQSKSTNSLNTSNHSKITTDGCSRSLRSQTQSKKYYKEKTSSITSQRTSSGESRRNSSSSSRRFRGMQDNDDQSKSTFSIGASNQSKSVTDAHSLDLLSEARPKKNYKEKNSCAMSQKSHSGESRRNSSSRLKKIRGLKEDDTQSKSTSSRSTSNHSKGVTDEYSLSLSSQTQSNKNPEEIRRDVTSQHLSSGKLHRNSSSSSRRFRSMQEDNSHSQSIYSRSTINHSKSGDSNSYFDPSSETESQQIDEDKSRGDMTYDADRWSSEVQNQKLLRNRQSYTA